MSNSFIFASVFCYMLGKTPDFALSNQYNNLVTPTSICETYTPQTHLPFFFLLDLGLTPVKKNGIEGKLKN